MKLHRVIGGNERENKYSNVKSTFMLFHVSFFNPQSYLNLFVFRHTFSIKRVYREKRRKKKNKATAEREE